VSGRVRLGGWGEAGQGTRGRLGSMNTANRRAQHAPFCLPANMPAHQHPPAVAVASPVDAERGLVLCWVAEGLTGRLGGGLPVLLTILHPAALSGAGAAALTLLRGRTVRATQSMGGWRLGGRQAGRA